MIRIKTTFGDKRVNTSFYDGKWTTHASGRQSVDAASLFEAGHNHLRAAAALQASAKATEDLNIEDVHTEHCCGKHGCKYGDDSCAVATGKAKASYSCEWCSDEKIDETYT